MNSGGSQGGSTGEVANARRRLAAAAKLATPLDSPYPLPAPVRRQATVAPWSLSAEPSRLAKVSVPS